MAKSIDRISQQNKQTLIVDGVDISLSNLGLFKFKWCNGVLTPVKMLLVETEPEAKKKNIRVNFSDLTRARKMFDALYAWTDNSDFVFVEMPVGSQNARAMASYGVSIGIVASVSENIIPVLPEEVKIAACRSKTASKADMVEWAARTYPAMPWVKATRSKKSPNKIWADKNEHCADAAAAVHAGLQTEEFRRAVTMVSKLKLRA
jgi:hypothetical protein